MNSAALLKNNTRNIAMSVILLVYGIWHILSVNFHEFGGSQMFQYYLHYGEGYVHRGLIGSLVRVFIGTPETQWLKICYPAY